VNGAGTDEDLVSPELDEASIRWQRFGTEAASVVADEAQVPEPLHEPGDHTLAGDEEVSRPDVDSSQRLS
jgi:hypothetical protein